MNNADDEGTVRRLLAIAVLVIILGEGCLAAIAAAKMGGAPEPGIRPKRTIAAPTPR